MSEFTAFRSTIKPSREIYILRDKMSVRGWLSACATKFYVRSISKTNESINILNLYLDVFIFRLIRDD